MSKIAVCISINKDEVLANWHPVTVNFPSSEIEYPYAKWNIEFATGPWHGSWTDTDYEKMTYWFENEDDAIRFKLTWL